MPRHVRRLLARFISVTAVTLLTTAADSRAESAGGDPLFGAARRVLSPEISTSAVARALRAGLWSPSREAVAASFPRPAGTVVFVFIRQPSGEFLAADASHVEGANLAKLGRSRAYYDKVETAPARWLERNDGWLQVVMRTSAWKSGRRFTVSEPLLIKPDGTVMWR